MYIMEFSSTRTDGTEYSLSMKWAAFIQDIESDKSQGDLSSFNLNGKTLTLQELFNILSEDDIMNIRKRVAWDTNLMNKLDLFW